MKNQADKMEWFRNQAKEVGSRFSCQEPKKKIQHPKTNAEKGLLMMDREVSILPVLPVEDEEGDVLLIRRSFQKAQVPNPITHVPDGEKAVAYLGGVEEYADRQRFPLPILVLLDLKLPRRLGLEVLAWRGQQPWIRRIPAIVITSSQQHSKAQQTYDLGANSYPLKPVQPSTSLR